MSSNTPTAAAVEVFRKHPEQPVGGAIVDATGREVTITEGMVRKACHELEHVVVAPAQDADPAPIDGGSRSHTAP